MSLTVRPAEDVPETTPQPVAYISGYHKGRCIIEAVNPDWLLPVGMALYRSPPNQYQDTRRMVEPVAWMRVDRGHVDFHRHPDYLPLYTAPPKREPLTSEELKSIREHQRLLEELGPVWAPMLYYFCRAIEQAHGIGGEE